MSGFEDARVGNYIVFQNGKETGKDEFTGKTIKSGASQ